MCRGQPCGHPVTGVHSAEWSGNSRGREVLDLGERDSLLDEPRGAGVAHRMRWVVRRQFRLSSRRPALPMVIVFVVNTTASRSSRWMSAQLPPGRGRERHFPVTPVLAGGRPFGSATRSSPLPDSRVVTGRGPSDHGAVRGCGSDQHSRRAEDASRSGLALNRQDAEDVPPDQGVTQCDHLARATPPERLAVGA